MASLFHLDWFKDNDGYRIKEGPKRSAGGGEGALLLTGSRPRRTENLYIVRNGGALLPTTPMEIDGLLQALASCDPSPTGIKRFVDAYGFLRRARARSEPVSDFIERIVYARHWIAAAEKGEWDKIAGWLQGARLDGTFVQHGGIGRLGLIFAPSQKWQQPEIRLRPANLYEAALVQFLYNTTHGRKLKACHHPNCINWFAYGAGTKHRGTALYCSPRCKNAHIYMKRKDSQS